jgi:RNA-directed DNA polymerase
MTGSLTPDLISTKLQRIAELARQAPAMAFRSLAHHIDIALLRRAYQLTRKGGATGVDGQTAEEYAKNLDENLKSLLDRFKSGTYKAPPVRRVHIPKGDGKSRPIGIPTFEDKVLQRAVTMVLNAVYEQDFRDFSYGFRPGRSAHQLLDALGRAVMAVDGGWVLDVDIKGFFDTLVFSHLRAFLDQRIIDGVLRRMIDKWLKAGVMEDGAVHRVELGTPQGGVISPLLANIYLHEVLDLWFVRDVQPRLTAQATLLRYADDFVIIFEEESDARRVLEVLPQRFSKFGLTIHPEKTKLVPFQRPRATETVRKASRHGGPGTFDFLGFTHYWALSRKRCWWIFRKTSSKRFDRALARIAAWCQESRQLPVPQQHRDLSLKLKGHYQYYGLIGNWTALDRFRFEVGRVWHKWLNRRSQRRSLKWDEFNVMLQRYPLPRPRLSVRAPLVRKTVSPRSRMQ